MNNGLSYAFFGTSEFAVSFLEELAKIGGTLPSLIITNPDRPAGRGLRLTPPPVKVWANTHGIEVWQPEKLDASFTEKITPRQFDLFMVVAYGGLLPKKVFTLPKYKTMNLHPSLLPRYRGPSPIETQIQSDDRDTGITLMEIDEKTDHGPIIAAEKVPMPHWPIDRLTCSNILAQRGAILFTATLPRWKSGKVSSTTQDESRATHTRKITKEDALLDLSDDPYLNWLKILAFRGMLDCYFIHRHNDTKVQVKIRDASYENGALTITRVLPENKKEMSYEEFLRGAR